MIYNYNKKLIPNAQILRAKDCTKLIIAHRLTTIRDADYILFLEEGKITEQGSPYDLIRKKGGKFKDYWDKQFLFQEEKNPYHGDINPHDILYVAGD